MLGTDGQGRDMLSAILYGLRVSLTVGVAERRHRAHARRARSACWPPTPAAASSSC